MEVSGQLQNPAILRPGKSLREAKCVLCLYVCMYVYIFARMAVCLLGYSGKCNEEFIFIRWDTRHRHNSFCALHLVWGSVGPGNSQGAVEQILSSVACPVLPYWSTLSHKRQDFREKVVEHKMCVLIFCTNLSGTFPIIRRIRLSWLRFFRAFSSVVTQMPG
jgi:hypothetical protein